jgi:SulP family sulfate permease
MPLTPKLVTTLGDYDRKTFLGDLIAGTTVAMVALPLSIAIAIASGAAPASGIVTAIVAGFLISLLGGSRVQIGGPTGAFIVIVYGVIADHGYHGLVLATLMAGVILLIASVFRAGRLIALVPEPVVNGFTIGIGIVIATSQIKDGLGLSVAQVPAGFLPKLHALWAARDTASGPSAALFALSIVLIVAFRRLAPRLPGVVLSVALVSALAAVLAVPVDTIAARYGNVPAGLPEPIIPSVSLARLIELLPSALVIAFLAGVESLLSALVADRMIGSAHRPNAELLAQGAANLGSSLFGGLPATGAIARTATNVRAGGRTPVAGLIHALVILTAASLGAGWIGALALPALAAVLVVTAFNMTEPPRWRSHLALPLPDQLLLWLTLILTVVTDLTVAIGVGVALGLGLRLLRRESSPPDWHAPDR